MIAEEIEEPNIVNTEALLVIEKFARNVLLIFESNKVGEGGPKEKGSPKKGGDSTKTAETNENGVNSTHSKDQKIDPKKLRFRININ